MLLRPVESNGSGEFEKILVLIESFAQKRRRTQLTFVAPRMTHVKFGKPRGGRGHKYTTTIEQDALFNEEDASPKLAGVLLFPSLFPQRSLLLVPADVRFESFNRAISSPLVDSTHRNVPD